MFYLMGKCHYEVLQLNGEVIAVVKYHCMLETLRVDEDNQQETYQVEIMLGSVVFI